MNTTIRRGAILSLLLIVALLAHFTVVQGFREEEYAQDSRNSRTFMELKQVNRGQINAGGQVLAATAAVADAVTDAVGGPDGTTGTVAVHLGARRDEVLALLGVLRTGRPFTVLRQDDPPGRLSAALADAQVTAVLTDRPGLLTGAVAEGVVVVPLPGLPGTGTDLSLIHISEPTRPY